LVLVGRRGLQPPVLAARAGRLLSAHTQPQQAVLVPVLTQVLVGWVEQAVLATLISRVELAAPATMVLTPLVAHAPAVLLLTSAALEVIRFLGAAVEVVLVLKLELLAQQARAAVRVVTEAPAQLA
jgi:hypothetical protein